MIRYFNTINSFHKKYSTLYLDIVPQRSPQVEVEYFGETAIVLGSRHRDLTELDEKRNWFFKHIDGRRDLTEVAKAYANTFNASDEQAQIDVEEICVELLQKDIVTLVYHSVKGDHMDTTRYTRGK